MRQAAADTLADVKTALRPGWPQARLLPAGLLQSYPSRAAPTRPDVRAPGERYDRFTAGGARFFVQGPSPGRTTNSSRRSARPSADAAHDSGAEFLDLSRVRRPRGLLDDHGACRRRPPARG
ncbi:hypothetical protein ACU686_13610 [Yinghuangia aomiensis]